MESDRPAAEPVRGRGAEVDDGLPVEGLAIADADGQDPRCLRRAGGRHRRGEAPVPDLAEGLERLQLAVGAAVDLAERAVPGGRTHDRHDEEIGRDDPGLIGHDAQLHELSPSGVWGRMTRDRCARWLIGPSVRQPKVRPAGCRAGGGQGLEGQVEPAAGLLDRDDGLVQPAAADVGDDHDQAAVVRRQLGPGVALLLEGGPHRVGDLAAGVPERGVEGGQGEVVAPVPARSTRRGSRRRSSSTSWSRIVTAASSLAIAPASVGEGRRVLRSRGPARPRRPRSCRGRRAASGAARPGGSPR